MLMRGSGRVFAIVAGGLASLVAAASGGTAGSPISLTAPTGYRDYCDGMRARQQRRVCGHGGVPLALWRPLKLPPVAEGQPCPAARWHAISRGVRGVGPGPVYSTHVIPWQVLFPAPENSVAAGTGWGIDKTPLICKKRFHSPFLIRGARIDEEGQLGFSGPAGRRPFAAMQFARERWGLDVAGLHGWPVAVWMTTPGCYAFQIDTRTLSRVIVFRIQPVGS